LTGAGKTKYNYSQATRQKPKQQLMNAEGNKEHKAWFRSPFMPLSQERDQGPDFRKILRYS